MELKFRNLHAEEIEVRVGNVAKDKSWISLLLFQNSRIAMDLLDEYVGKENWKREHSRDNKNCTISIWDNEKQQWVGKEDTGVESQAEKEKGLASDSFKRSAVNWGIGRSLYSAPNIFLYGNSDELKHDKYSVKEIKYDDKDKITDLIIINKSGETVFTYPKKNKTNSNNKNIVQTTDKKAPSNKVVNVLKTEQLRELLQVANNRSDVLTNIAKDFGYESPRQIKVEDFEKIKTAIEAEILM